MNSKFRFNLCCLLTLTFILLGCKVKRPDDVISESKMENLLYDYYIAKAMGDNLPYNENYKKALYVDAVFKKYNTTEEQLDSSLVWYTRNTEILGKIYVKVTKRLKDQQDAINHVIASRDNKPKMSMPGDSIDVWPWRRLIRLSDDTNDSHFTFTMPSDTNFKDRDTLIWEARYHFLEPSQSKTAKAATMAMQIIYEKDTLNRLINISQSGNHQIRMHADTLGAIKEIRGFIYYPQTGKKERLLLADNLKLTRYHCLDSLSFVERDSLNKIEALKTDSLKKIAAQKEADALGDSLNKANEQNDNQRLTPEEMNRRRTGTTVKKPEQVKVEEHIKEEQIEQRNQRIKNNQRRNQQRRQNQQR